MTDKYDVVIIGAGIGGLVCANYLVKLGMKVLLVEKQPKVGGCCTSFTKDGFTFDTGIHALGSCRDSGYIGRVLLDLGLKEKASIKRTDPSDVIIISEDKYSIRNSLENTIEEFQLKFPGEARNIKKFFEFLAYTTLLELYIKLDGKTFRDLLNRFFSDKKLKSTISVFLGCLQLPSDKVCGLSTAILYKEFILDGGYYPRGGMQKFSDMFADNFVHNGGDLRANTAVTKIISKNGKVEGVMIEGENYIKAKYVVSCCDAMTTFFELLDDNQAVGGIRNRLEKLTPSSSAFVVYLGLKETIKEKIPHCCSLWYAPSYETDETLSKLYDSILNLSEKYVLFSFLSAHDNEMAPKNKESICLIIGAPYLSKEFWQKNKKRVAENIIDRASIIVPKLADMIEVKESASPLTFHKFTQNFHGAFRGWASTPYQTKKNILPQEVKSLQNLFLAGHWVTQPAQGGVPMVADSGRNVAKIICRKEKHKLRNNRDGSIFFFGKVESSPVFAQARDSGRVLGQNLDSFGPHGNSEEVHRGNSVKILPFNSIKSV